MSNASDTPWDDCKVAFGVASDVDAIFAWAERVKRHFPKGWAFDGTDASGARMVALFRVEGPLSRTDGERIAKSLRTLEANAEGRVPCPCCNGQGTCMLCDDNGRVEPQK